MKGEDIIELIKKLEAEDLDFAVYVDFLDYFTDGCFDFEIRQKGESKQIVLLVR